MSASPFGSWLYDGQRRLPRHDSMRTAFAACGTVSIMAWEWVAPTVTGTVALAGIGATLRTAAQARLHAERLATENHARAREQLLRQELMRLYVDALAHALDLERRLASVWVHGGDGQSFNISVQPRGGPVNLASMDEISVRMQLLAEPAVEEAWKALNTAWEARQWWAENEYSGDPREEAPSELTSALLGAIDRLKTACRSALD